MIIVLGHPEGWNIIRGRLAALLPRRVAGPTGCDSKRGTFQPRAKKHFLALQAGQPWASGWSIVWGNSTYLA